VISDLLQMLAAVVVSALVNAPAILSNLHFFVMLFPDEDLRLQVKKLK